jgi:protein TonB
MKTVRAALIAALTVAALPLMAPVAHADAYDDTVNAQIRKNAEYPRLAKLHSLEGTVGFQVKIEANGAVSDASVESSSGQASLDNAALDTIKHLNFPAPTGGARTVHGTLAYRLM